MYIFTLQWTKFVDSPTSTLSSPGLKPVNFDFQKSAVEQVCLQIFLGVRTDEFKVENLILSDLFEVCIFYM